MKNILIITDSYPPEIRSASHLMKELAEGLKEKGYKVYIATSFPQYNLTENEKNKKYFEFMNENGINIIRIKTLPHHKVNFIIRGISQLIMPYIFEKKILKYVKKIEIIIVYSPPLTLSITAIKLKKIFKAKFILNVQDIFPQNAIDLGILKNPILIKFFKIIENNAYENADYIFVHSEGNLEFLKNNHKNLNQKLFVLHNWIDVKEFEGVKRSFKFRKLYNLENKFIILFAGVLGPSQGLHFIVDLAERVKDIDNLIFLFVGDGMDKNRLEHLVYEKKLKNVLFKSFVSKEEYPELVKDCDIGLVCLTNKNKTPVVPGKILGYMAASIPVLAFLNKESDGHLIIKNSKCGFSCEYGDLNNAEFLLRKLYSYKNLEELGKNGYIYVKENFNKDVILEKLIKYFNNGG